MERGFASQEARPWEQDLGFGGSLDRLGVGEMATIGWILVSGVIAVVMVIGLADALVHLLCWTARSLPTPEGVESASPSTDAARRQA
jgi:hypothetical protein